MGYRYSLAFLTISEASPVEAVHIAAAAGYDHVGLRLLPASTDGPYPLLTDDKVLAETRRAVEETGVTIADLEIVKITPEFDPATLRPFLERGQALGAKHILTAGYDPDMARMTDSYGAFCELAHAHGMTADLEFMPWTDVPDVGTAAAVVAAANHPAAAILIDALHVQRSNSPFETIAGLNPAWINYAQLCDAPGVFDAAPEALIATARGARMMPGDGDFDFTPFLKALPRDIVLSVEVVQADRIGVVPPLARAEEALAKARQVVDVAFGALTD